MPACCISDRSCRAGQAMCVAQKLHQKKHERRLERQDASLIPTPLFAAAGTSSQLCTAARAATASSDSGAAPSSQASLCVHAACHTCHILNANVCPAGALQQHPPSSPITHLWGGTGCDCTQRLISDSSRGITVPQHCNTRYDRGIAHGPVMGFHVPSTARL